MAAMHGFELCRFTRPEISEGHRMRYRYWVREGMHGQMAWMAEEGRMERRQYPDRMLAGVKTVIALGMRHSPPPYTLAEVECERGRGVIAAYAHGDDYHEVMKKRLKALARDLDGLLGRHEQRVYVDTAPVLEHAFAESSGLGWQGRHSLTINRQFGSWLLLGEIFTTAEIAPDPPSGNHCGSCTACLDICPTGAIVAPYVVDARLCISYLTIEYCGFIPRRLRPLMGNRIFGCDDCQMICPWNRHATPPAVDLLYPRRENALPRLAGILQLDEEGFRNRFRKSPVRRAGRAGLVRNACIAAGNSGKKDLVPVLIHLLGDSSSLVRGHAAWALGRLARVGERERIDAALEHLRQREKDPVVLEEIYLSADHTKDIS